MRKWVSQRIHRWMNVVLFVAVGIEFCLLLNQWLGRPVENVLDLIHQEAHALALFLIVVYILLRQVHRRQLTRIRVSTDLQMAGMASLLSTVRHELNNDMQVVVGNAELAGILIKSGGDAKATVSHIATAASAAIVRINQLSVFNATNPVPKTPVNLNAILRQSAARLTEKLSRNTVVRLELDRLPGPILIDRDLFTLNLTNLLFRAAQHMDTHYEIVLRTVYSSAEEADSCSVGADFVFIPDRSGHSGIPASANDETTHLTIESLLSDSAAVMDLCGAVSVRYDCTPTRTQMSMQFRSASEVAKPTLSAKTGRHTTQG